MIVSGFVLIYVRGGCVDTVSMHPSIQKAIDSFDMNELNDPEGDDLAVYDSEGGLKARWFPGNHVCVDNDDGAWVHINEM